MELEIVVDLLSVYASFCYFLGLRLARKLVQLHGDLASPHKSEGPTVRQRQEMINAHERFGHWSIGRLKDWER